MIVNENLPLITIVTVCMNSEKYLQECIESVLSQEYENIEYIIIDGKSTDKTIEIIKQFENYLSFWKSEKDNGVYDAMNKSLEYAHGDFIMFLNSDDVLLDTQSINRIVNYIDNDKFSWYTGFIEIIDSYGKNIGFDKLRSYSFRKQMMSNIIRHPATIIPLSYIKENKFSTEYKYAADYLLFLRIWKQLGDPCFIHSYISGFRLTGTNLSSNFYSSLNDEMRARIHFRKETNKWFFIISDYFIFVMRLLKLKLKQRKL